MEGVQPAMLVIPCSSPHSGNMALETVSSSLPVLPLLNDIVFPASQVTISVPRSFASYLSRIVKNEDGQTPLVAASPALNSGPILQYQDVQLSEWACGTPKWPFIAVV